MINILFDNDQNLNFLISNKIYNIDKNDIDLLLQNGANANGIIYSSFYNEVSGSYFQHALFAQRLDIAKVLLKFNATIEKVENSLCHHPIFYVLEHKDSDIEFLKLIIMNTNKVTIIKLLKEYIFHDNFTVYAYNHYKKVPNAKVNYTKLVDTLIDMKLDNDYLEYFI